MMSTEIYLTKKVIAKENWQKLIRIISNYNGTLRKFQIIITNHQNQIRYFIKTRYSLPSTINHLDTFLLKPETEPQKPEATKIGFYIPKIEDNIIDLINYYDIKRKKKVIYLEITFLKLYKDKIISTINYYTDDHSLIKKHKLLFAIPTNILSVNFEENKRFFYKGAPKYLDIKKVLHLLNTDANNSILNVDTFPYLQGNFYLSQSCFDFDKHTLLLGASGSGKSKFISLFIHNIYKNELLKQKYKVVIIDPHAALEEDIGGIGKVIDFQSKLDSIDLFMNCNQDIITTTELLLELFKSQIADQYNAKLERVLRHCLSLLLMDEAFNFINLRKVILEVEYRNDLINKLRYKLPTSVIDFFLTDFNDLKTRSYGTAITPIISFIDEMEMIPIFNSKETSENIKDTIENHFMTLFSLDRTKLGDTVTKTIAGLIMQQLLTLMQSKEIKEHILFIIDEVAIIENPILARYLSESRKYNVSLILAGQYLSQVSDTLKNAIFANVINYFVFRVSKLDAMLLADNFNLSIPLDNSKETKIKLLTELNNRECIVRCSSNGILLPAFKASTLSYQSIPRVKKSQDIQGEDDKKVLKKKKPFAINNNICLKDILKANSSSRKVVK